jgi:phosphatidate cytidylyltransferase
MLAQRVTTAVVLLAALVAAIFLLPPAGLAAVLLALVLAAAYEWGRLAGYSQAVASAYAIGVAAVCVALVAAPSARFEAGWPPATVLAICGAATAFWVLVATPWVIARWPARPRALVAAIGVLVITATWMALVALCARSPWTLLAAMGVVFVADTAAYFTGRRFGRRKLAPQVSPGKTWEGVAGAAVAVAVYAIVCARLASLAGAKSLALAVAGALVLAALAIVGDLFESWLKRNAGVKDSGRILPGHGGALDRIDALLAAMPPAAVAAAVLVQ